MQPLHCQGVALEKGQVWILNPRSTEVEILKVHETTHNPILTQRELDGQYELILFADFIERAEHILRTA